MKKLVLGLLLTLLIYSCIKVNYLSEEFLLETLLTNNDERLMNYNVIDKNAKHIVWQEEFDNNNSKWPVDTSIYKVINQNTYYYSIFPQREEFKTIQMREGLLMIHGYKLGIGMIDIPFIIDESENFEIEMKAYNSENTVGNSQARTIIGLSNSNNIKYNLFLYKWNDNIDIVFEKEKNGKNIQIFAWNSKDYIKINNLNTITIRKIGEKYAFFFNYKLFYILNDKEFSCNKSYIILHDDIEYMFDYIRIKYIDN